MNLGSGHLYTPDPQCLESYPTEHTLLATPMHPHDVLVPLFIQIIFFEVSHVYLINCYGSY